MINIDELRKIWNVQSSFQKNFFDTEKMSLEEREKWTKEYILSIASETFELLNECNWKRHVVHKKELDHDKLTEECVDIFKFWLNLCLIWGITPDMFVEKFYAKSRFVEERYAKELESIKN